MSTELVDTHHEISQSAGTDQYLTFRLCNENYGLDILKVQEIRGYDGNVTSIANAPAFIKGVVNLRGNIVPIIDMRIKFHLPDPSYDGSTVIIILNLEKQVVGMVVDTVSDVLTIHAEAIKPAPSLGAADIDYVKGIGTVEDKMVILVDIERLISSDVLAAVEVASL